MLGATDEYQQPIQKATALVPNFKWKKTSKRCSGHRGKLHGQLQGKKIWHQPHGTCSGVSKINVPAHVPRRDLLPQRVTTVADLRHGRKAFTTSGTATSTSARSAVWAKLRRPAWNNSLLPGECHHGRYPTADGKRPRKNPEAPSSSPINDWKKPARNSPMEDVTLELPQAVSLGPAARVYWKVALFQVIQDALAVFSEATDIGKDYVKHWTMDEPQDLSICSQRTDL